MGGIEEEGEDTWTGYATKDGFLSHPILHLIVVMCQGNGKGNMIKHELVIWNCKLCRKRLV